MLEPTADERPNFDYWWELMLEPTAEERTFPRGTIFKFPEYGDELYILASMGDNNFNLVSLKDGNRKTETWTNSRMDANKVEVPLYTWRRGGPPIIVSVPKGTYRDKNEQIELLNRMERFTPVSLNKKLIDLMPV
jgi:hypothetical protein